LNDGTGQFSDSGQVLGNDETRDVSMGDADGDGDLDLLSANSTVDMLWLNDGSGTFSDSGQALSDESAVGARLGDLDADNDLDMLVVNADATHSVWLNSYQPTVTTGAVTDIGADSVTAAGRLITLGVYPVTAHGFVWNSTGDPTLNDTVMDLGAASDTGDFSSKLSDLSLAALIMSGLMRSTTPVQFTGRPSSFRLPLKMAAGTDVSSVRPLNDVKR
jgi:hypothetical protein